MHEITLSIQNSPQRINEGGSTAGKPHPFHDIDETRIRSDAAGSGIPLRVLTRLGEGNAHSTLVEPFLDRMIHGDILAWMEF